jgi:hypothetical protein
LVDLNFEAQFCAARQFDSGGDVQQIVIARTALKFQVCLDERQKNLFGFQFGIGHMQPPAHEFGAAALEPFQGAGIVECPHLVRFAVTDAQLKDIMQSAHISGGRRLNRQLLPPETRTAVMLEL